MTSELYEKTYKNAGHFSFGTNWRSFVESLTPAQVITAQKSLTAFLELKDLRGKRFLDLGCGSGLFSVAAYRLGADEMVSVDIDEDSIAATRYLWGKEKQPSRWHIVQASALDKNLARRLGTFDLVYSWGVLHHTGAMYRALENASRLVKSGGLFYIAIYNDNKTNWLHGTSNFWVKIKRVYNHSNELIKRLLYHLYSAYLWLGLLVSGKNPTRYIRDYRTNRGMSWEHDIIDWLGGYPYEFAPPEKIIAFVEKMGFVCKKMKQARAIGNNEYLFVRKR